MEGKQPAAPLAGIRVIDFTELLPGPFLSQCLVDMGAEVIKVERPPHGDNARVMGPGVFAAVNRGKRSVVIDLKDQAGRDEAMALLQDCDLVLEGYRPGVMQKLGIGYEVVSRRNPGVIYLSLSGYGQDGPDAMLPGHDLNYLAAAGVVAISGQADGDPVSGFGLPFADLSSALYALSSVLAALHQRRDSGRGQWLDVSMSDCLLHMMNCRMSHFAYSGSTDLQAQRRTVLARPAYGVFRTLDGQFITLGALEPHFWEKLVVALELTDLDPAWKGHAQRSADALRVNERLRARMAAEGFDSLCARLRSHDVPYSPVVPPAELAEHPHHRARGMFQTVEQDGRKIPVARFPVKIDGMVDSAAMPVAPLGRKRDAIRH